MVLGQETSPVPYYFHNGELHENQRPFRIFHVLNLISSKVVKGIHLGYEASISVAFDEQNFVNTIGIRLLTTGVTKQANSIIRNI